MIAGAKAFRRPVVGGADPSGSGERLLSRQRAGKLLVALFSPQHRLDLHGKYHGIGGLPRHLQNLKLPEDDGEGEDEAEDAEEK